MNCNYTVLNQQVFTYENFSIVPIRYQDRTAIMKWRNEQVYHLRQHKELTIEDQDNYFNHTVAKLFEHPSPDQILFSFLRDDICIGYGGLVHINWIDKNAEISFIMDTGLERFSFKDLWTVYLKLIEQVAFGQLNLHKIFTYAFDVRPLLYPILENSGYRHEATLKHHCCFEGSFIDVLIHAKIRHQPYLRKVDFTDKDLTYKWANDDNIRKYSFNRKVISFEEHSSWFERKINNDRTLFYILCVDDQSIGSIRLDLDVNEEGLISYLISPNHHGKGYGKLILMLIEEQIKLTYPNGMKIKGQVFWENIPSIKIFRALGYQEFEFEENLMFEKKI